MAKSSALTQNGGWLNFGLFICQLHPSYKFCTIQTFNSSFINNLELRLKYTYCIPNENVEMASIISSAKFQSIVLFLDDYGRKIFFNELKFGKLHLANITHMQVEFVGSSSHLKIGVIFNNSRSFSIFLIKIELFYEVSGLFYIGLCMQKCFRGWVWLYNF